MYCLVRLGCLVKGEYNSPVLAVEDVDLSLFINGVSLNGAIPFIDEQQPQISWNINSREEGRWMNLQQVSYQVHVNGILTSRPTGEKDNSMRQTITTISFRSNEMHEVRVSVVLSNGYKLERKGYFKTALMNTVKEFANADWINGGTLLRRKLDSPGASQVANATLYASGVGCFSVKIDDVLISNSFMDPSWATVPTERVTYRAYDVTNFYNDTSSYPAELTVSLGMCKYSYQDSYCVGGHASTDVCKAFIMTFVITYQDGTTTTIDSSATDGRWEATTAGNPIQYSHLYHGEQYDGRVTGTWTPAVIATFDTGDVNFQQPVNASMALGELDLLAMPPLIVNREYVPSNITSVSGGQAWVFDMSANMAGFARLSVKRSALVDGVPLVLK